MKKPIEINMFDEVIKFFSKQKNITEAEAAFSLGLNISLVTGNDDKKKVIFNRLISMSFETGITYAVKNNIKIKDLNVVTDKIQKEEKVNYMG